MKKLLLTFLALTASLLPLLAQDYAPFSMGRTPYYQAGDSIYSLRITNVVVQGGDSVFEFNPRIVPVPQGWNPTPSFYDPQVMIPDNLFGQKMIKIGSNEYYFEVGLTNMFLLKPTAPVGASWTFSQWPSITATLQSKALEAVQGIPDSVITISLSNGGIIKISRNFGLVSARSFYSYHNSTSTSQSLLLVRLPEFGIGNIFHHPFQIYDFQVGDKFLYKGHQRDLMQLCYEYWSTTEVLSRNQNADSIWYELRKQIYSIANPGGPLGTCNFFTGTNIPPGTNLSAFDTVTFVVKPSAFPYLSDLSREYVNRPQPWSHLPNLGHYKSTFSNRLEALVGMRGHDPSTATFYYIADGSGYYRYVEGLGRVEYLHEPRGAEELIAYIKGTETFGTWQPLTALEKDPAQQPLQVYPNPFTSELTLQFPQLHTSPAEILLLDLLGRTVYRQQLQATETQQQTTLFLPELPAGLYLLQLKQAGRSYTAKVQRQ